MHRLVRTVLSKLYTLDPVNEEKKLLDVPSTPVVGTLPSSVTRSKEPVSYDPTDAPQPVTPTLRSPQDAIVTQKSDCMS
jgi:hypothetical protein